MGHYVLIESRDPYESADVGYFYDLAGARRPCLRSPRRASRSWPTPSRCASAGLRPIVSSPACARPRSTSSSTVSPRARKRSGTEELPWPIEKGIGVHFVAEDALAAGGGGSKSGNNTSSGVKTTTFPNEVVVFGGGRDFVVDVRGSGTLTARADWQQDGVLLSMYVVDLANPMRVLADGNQTASKQVSLSLPVTPASYRISVTNSTGAGPRVDTTFTLTVTHP